MNKYREAAKYKRDVEAAMERVSKWKFHATLKNPPRELSKRLKNQRDNNDYITEEIEYSEGWTWFEVERKFGRSRSNIREMLTRPPRNRKDLVIKINRNHVEAHGQPFKGQQMEVK